MSETAASQVPELPLRDNGLSDAPARPARTSLLRRAVVRAPLLLATLILGAFIGLYFQPPGLQAAFRATGLQPGAGNDTPIAVATQQVQTQQEIAVVSEGDIVALGRILPQGDVISIATPFGAGDARIAALEVSVGDYVQTGDVLATLDNRNQLLSAIEAAEATVAVREASLRQTREALRASRAEAQAALESAEASAIEAQAELTRAASLLDRGVVTQADYDQFETRATQAAREVERNLATLSRFDPSSGNAMAELALGEANLDAARVEVTRAWRNLDQSTVRAPTEGTILRLNAQVGERPGAEGILDMGDTRQMTVEAEVYQTLIGRVSVGDPVTITAEALDGPLAGAVQAVGLKIGRQSITSDDPAANTDARVVDVIIWLDDASSTEASRYTNLEVIVRIDTGREG